MTERRHEDLREQRRLTLREGLVHAQVTRLDAESAQLPRSMHDLHVAGIERLAVVASNRNDETELREFPDERHRDAQHRRSVLERERALVLGDERQRVGHADRAALQLRRDAAPVEVGELLADHREREEVLRWSRRIISTRATSACENLR